MSGKQMRLPWSSAPVCPYCHPRTTRICTLRRAIPSQLKTTSLIASRLPLFPEYESWSPRDVQRFESRDGDLPNAFSLVRTPIVYVHLSGCTSLYKMLQKNVHKLDLVNHLTIEGGRTLQPHISKTTPISDRQGLPWPFCLRPPSGAFRMPVSFDSPLRDIA